MRLKEQRLWDRMRRALGAMVHMERVENIMKTGMPDILALADGQTSFVELKAVDNYPARATTRVLGSEGLSQAQKNWHLTWQQNCGNSYILVAVGLDHYLLDGMHADEINGYTESELNLFAAATTWMDIAKRLGARV